jgi:hypothetical protein
MSEFVQEVDSFEKVIAGWCGYYGFVSGPIVVDVKPAFDVRFSRLESDDCGDIYMRGGMDEADCQESQLAHQLECGMWCSVTCERVEL